VYNGFPSSDRANAEQRKKLRMTITIRIDFSFFIKKSILAKSRRAHNPLAKDRTPVIGLYSLLKKGTGSEPIVETPAETAIATRLSPFSTVCL
jgi:hypothetical protein